MVADVTRLLAGSLGFLDGSLEVPPLRVPQQRLDVSGDPELRPVLVRLLQIFEPLHSEAGKWFVAHDHLLSLDGCPAGIYRTVNEGVTVCPGFRWPRSGRSASLTRIRRQGPWFEVPGNLSSSGSSAKSAGLFLGP